MKRVSCLVLVAVAATGCVAPVYPGAGGLGSYGRRAYGPAIEVARETPVGRWDSVMMLAPGTPVRVLMADGLVATGAFVSATLSTLRIDAAAETALVAADVLRVDRLAGLPSSARVRQGVSGVVTGAGMVAVLGLLTGHVPPARTFAAGAIIGGYAQSQASALVPGPGTIYLAPGISPRRESGPR